MEGMEGREYHLVRGCVFLSFVGQILADLHKSCQQDDGTDDPKKATSLLEIYALYIQVYNAQNDFPNMAQMYHRVMHVKNAAPSAMVNGVLREAGGMVEAKNGGWAQAYRSFFDAFHSYDEAGHVRRLQCLKYVPPDRPLDGQDGVGNCVVWRGAHHARRCLGWWWW